MSQSKSQELIIVKAISEMVIPDDIFENSQFKEVITNYKDSQDKVNSNLEKQRTTRKAVEDGSFFGNLIKGRNSALKDAQLDLNYSLGELTKQSSELILFNTAISKVLVSQQNILHSQQDVLQKQASEIEIQNTKINDSQIKIGEAQKRIEEAHAGLLKALKISDHQAIKLIDCADRLELAEQKMELSNRDLERSVEARIFACDRRSESIKSEVDEALCSYRKEAAVRFEAFSAEHNSAIEGLTGQFSNFELKIHTESEIRKQAVTSVVEEFNQRIDELQNEQEVSDKKLLSELESAKESFVSQIESLSLSLDKRDAESKQRIYELKNEQEVSDKKLLSELESTKESFVSQIESLSLSLDKRDAEFSEKNKRFFYFSVSAMIVAAISLTASVYIYLSA